MVVAAGAGDGEAQQALPRLNRAEYRNTLRDLLGFELIVRGLPQQPHHRRVSLDLTGLPPTPAEVDQFLNDKSPNPSENLTEHAFLGLTLTLSLIHI